MRVRLSNEFGTEPVAIGPVHIALHATGSAIQSGSDHGVTFGGKPTVILPKGGSALSDPVRMDIAALQELAVSLYLPAGSGPSTVHATGIQTVYFSGTGDATAVTAFPPGETDDSRYFLTDVEVATAGQARTLVILGDSITDGVGSTLDRNLRWPDVLAGRLQANPALASISVANSGIAGNRLLHDEGSRFVGPSALSRFDRDALNKPGVRWILLHEGINDIGAAGMLATPEDAVSAAQIIAGMKTLIARAHAKGIKIWGGTLLPFEGLTLLKNYYSEAGEAKRQAVNAWIRSSGAFDTVVDFDQVVRDPVHPGRLLPAYDSGDHLHPNVAGYQAMAAAIDLRWLTRD